MHNEPLIPGAVYHIYNHANGDDNLFREAENYRFFLQQYAIHISPVADTLAYCLLPNHFHLVIRIKEEEVLRANLPGFENLAGLEEAASFISKQFSNFFNSYSKAFNKKYNRRGSLFLKNFKRKLIRDDAYLIAVIAYVHLNPVKHGFVGLLQDWKWSSYHSIGSTAPTALLRDMVLEAFGGRSLFQTFHEARTVFFKEYEEIEKGILE